MTIFDMLLIPFLNGDPVFWFVDYLVRYLSIVKEEGLEISQPALDPDKSEIHHPLTVRKARSKVHRLTSFPPTSSCIAAAFIWKIYILIIMT
jgi:hypothetical protein